MSEVTEGELVMWSVDPGPMAGVLERQLWRMATAARSYLNRMRAAELAHGVVAGERDAVTVERDEARQEMSDNRSANLNSIGEKIHEIARLRKVREKLEDERDESRKDVANYERQINDARAILGAAPDELLSDAARRVRRDQEMAAAANQPRKTAMAATRAALETPDGVTVFERASDVMAELRQFKADQATVRRWHGWLNDAALAAGVSGYGEVAPAIARLSAGTDRLRVLTNIVGLSELATWDDLAARVRALVSDVAILGKHQGWVISALKWKPEPSYGDLWDYARTMAHKAGLYDLMESAESKQPQPGPMSITNDHIRDIAIAMNRRKTWNAADPAASWAELLADLRVALSGRCADAGELARILRARDGESLEAAASRLAASRDEMMEEASRARTELGARTNESAEDAALRVMRSLLKAQSALGEVFEIQHEITVAGDLVTIRVAPLRDPAIRALPMGVRLGLVVCDD